MFQAHHKQQPLDFWSECKKVLIGRDANHRLHPQLNFSRHSCFSASHCWNKASYTAEALTISKRTAGWDACLSVDPAFLQNPKYFHTVDWFAYRGVKPAHHLVVGCLPSPGASAMLGRPWREENFKTQAYPQYDDMDWCYDFASTWDH